MLVDSHCHLDFPDFADERDAVVGRAQEAGVGTLVTICTKISEFPPEAAIAERYPAVWCSVGIHPHEAAHQPATATADLVERARHRKVVGIGETGLDFHYDHSPRDRQREVFRAHIAAARESGLPLEGCSAGRSVCNPDATSYRCTLLVERMNPATLSWISFNDCSCA